MAIRKYVLFALLLIVAFISGWKAAEHRLIQIPMGKAKLEIPINCQHRIWMNAIETDCKDGVMIYYVSKMEHASPK
jgi:hypothetical protein